MSSMFAVKRGPHKGLSQEVGIGSNTRLFSRNIPRGAMQKLCGQMQITVK